MRGPRAAVGVWLVAVLLALPGCSESGSRAGSGSDSERGSAATDIAPRPAADVQTAWVMLGGETFTLELALDPKTRFQGLSGRTGLPNNGGMLFVFPHSESTSMVMRDCPEPIDVAFLDERGQVVAIHEMQPEPPRAASETVRSYERRLPLYPSRVPIRFAIETAGGRLRQVGVQEGSRVPLDIEALKAAAN